MSYKKYLKEYEDHVSEGLGAIVAGNAIGKAAGKLADMVGLDNVMTNFFKKGIVKKYLPRPEDQKLLQIIFAMEDSEFFDNPKNMKQLMSKKSLQRIAPLLYKWDPKKKEYMYQKIQDAGLSEKLDLNGYVKLVKQLKQEDPKRWKALHKDAKKILGQVTGLLHV